MKTKIIAFYLPQFYPTKENDEWWGKGFTEWTNVGKAKPLFPGHYQPKVPADLGYYDLRLPEVRQQQADMACMAGIYGFCYWHYWFAGKKILNRVFEEVVESGKPDYPFCLCWANHSWYKKTWSSKGKDKLLIEQTYPGDQDYINHFMYLLPAFKDERYIRINGKILFNVYAPLDLPNFPRMKQLWNDLAQQYGLGGFHFKGYTMHPSKSKEILRIGFDSVIVDYVYTEPNHFTISNLVSKFLLKFFNFRLPKSYTTYVKTIEKDYIPSPKNDLCIIPNFDHSPRSKMKGVIYYNSSPKRWGALLDFIFGRLHYNIDSLFIKAWNEWGEGNYLEPDLKYGSGFLDELRQAIKME